ncbi:uncharacterized protein [Phaseolus vulgaris]|uniref:uncharacterized protein n=1 Tax=Phaseolus vulgaris TaxID=3885 RepID=UPI0035CB04E1
MVCLQETKCSDFSREKVCLLWGTNEVDWVENKAVNSAGGVITMWSNRAFQLSSFVNGRNFSVLEGVWKRGIGTHVTIVNIYCSGSLREKKEMWNEISGFRQGQLSKAWCIIGDFNSVRRQEERKSVVAITDYSREIKAFNDFIESSELADIPLVGRKFTWFKPNGLVKSRIDRVLVSKEWLEYWPNSQQYVLNRFKDFVCSCWSSYKVTGGGIFVFKEKLKKLKADLKVWNREVFGDVNQASKEFQKRLEELDTRDEEDGLVESERDERKSLFAKLTEAKAKQEAILFQKARQSWIKQGDLNTKFFHSAVKWRRARNQLHGVFDNNKWCDSKEELGEFRPISLVGCLYKIISKVLSLRLKKVIGKIIDIRQSAFIEGRGLLDSVLIANEVLEEYKRKRKRCIFFKVDYEKAYDSVK